MEEERIERCLAQAEEAGIRSRKSTSELDLKASCHWVSYCDLDRWGSTKVAQQIWLAFGLGSSRTKLSSLNFH